MLNVLAAPEFDLDGYIELMLTSHPDQDETRRVNRALTLDGGVAISDGGYTPKDLTFLLEWGSSTQIDAAVRRLMRLHTQVLLSTRAGVFLVTLETFRLGSGGKSTVNCLVIDQLSA
ncbi:hypothetical protein [Caudoviricetes sp.]|nr:hypothetical protein [Caudoviricetes sp.]